MNHNILLVGSGPMAIEYGKVLKDLNRSFLVIGRGQRSAAEFEKQIGVPVIVGGIEKWLLEESKPAQFNKVIVAVGEKHLGRVTSLLLEYGFIDILVEKPGGIDVSDILELEKKRRYLNAKVFIGYNRRFYASTIEAKRIIEEDGGVTSFNFEFTEWSHIIQGIKKEEGVKENWFLQNSSHVVDLAFYLGGKPSQLSSFVSGSVSWHPSASVFAGAGCTENKALFSYQANWESPGRWSVEVLTKKHRLIFRPIERLQIQNIGSVAIEMVELDYELDIKYKPGLYKQTSAYLNSQYEILLSLQEQSECMNYYNKISFGSKSE